MPADVSFVSPISFSSTSQSLRLEIFEALGFCRLTSAMTSSVHFLGVQQQPLLSANPLNDTQRAKPSPMSPIFLQQPFPAQDNVAAAMLTFYLFTIVKLSIARLEHIERVCVKWKE